MDDPGLITSDQRSGRVPPGARRGVYYNWGPQAWIDMWMSNTMLVKRAMPIVTHTFLPILRLSGDAAQVDRDFARIRARRERIRWLDSPREKWRKRYGNFVRETEWALLELRKHFSQAQFEDIVVGTAVALSHETSGDFLEMMNSMASQKPRKARRGSAASGGSPSRWTRLMFNTFNPGHWLTGPATLSSYNPAGGEVVMDIPDCAWHTCAAAESLPDPNNLPQEGCLYICKGPFEALFRGEGGGLKMHFEPHLPETSCTVRMTWTPQ